MTNEILIVDDEDRIRRLLKLYLERESFEIHEARDGKEAYELALENNYACILLDLMLPEMDGIEVASKLREHKDTPIIMLTAKGKKQIVLKDLNREQMIILLPFSPREVVLRVKALLRRTQTANTEQSEPHARDIIEFSHLVIDNDAHRVLADDQQVNLTPKEYELLIYLAKTPNKVFDREQLLKEVWHYEFYGDLRTVDTHVKRLREKLNRVSSDAAQMIQTVWGVGYKFEVKPSDEPTK